MPQFCSEDRVVKRFTDKVPPILICLAVMALLMGCRLYYDLTHPENWDGDWFDDPRRYGPVVAIQLAVLVPVFLWKCYQQGRAVRRAGMYEFVRRKAEEALAAGRRDVHDAWWREWE